MVYRRDNGEDADDHLLSRRGKAAKRLKTGVYCEIISARGECGSTSLTQPALTALPRAFRGGLAALLCAQTVDFCAPFAYTKGGRFCLAGRGTI